MSRVIRKRDASAMISAKALRDATERIDKLVAENDRLRRLLSMSQQLNHKLKKELETATANMPEVKTGRDSPGWPWKSPPPRRKPLV